MQIEHILVPNEIGLIVTKLQSINLYKMRAIILTTIHAIYILFLKINFIFEKSNHNHE